MRKVSIIMLSAVLLSSGCTGDGFPDPESNLSPKTKENIIEMNVDHDYIRLWCGTKFTVKIISDGEFSVKSLDPSIATVELQEDQFIIRSKSPGETDIIIKDTNDPKRKSTFKCYSRVFANRWGEHIDLAKFYQNHVVIGAKDRSLANDITKELLSSTVYRYGATYDFVEDSDQVIVTLQTPEPGTKYMGNYSWDFSTGIFTVNYNDRSERYWADIQPPLSESTAPPFVIALHEDYTSEYSSRYPELGISEVTLIRYIVSFGETWWSDNQHSNDSNSVIF